MISNAAEARTKSDSVVKEREESREKRINGLYNSIIKGIDIAAGNGDYNLKVLWAKTDNHSCDKINEIMRGGKIELEVVDIHNLYMHVILLVRQRLEEQGFRVRTDYTPAGKPINLYIVW